jgi:hypothetical protein
VVEFAADRAEDAKHKCCEDTVANMKNSITTIAASVVAFIGVLATLAGNLSKIEDFLGRTLGQTSHEPAVTTREVMVIDVKETEAALLLPAAMLKTVQLVVRNTGDRDATNCKGQLLFDEAPPLELSNGSYALKMPDTPAGLYQRPASEDRRERSGQFHLPRVFHHERKVYRSFKS